MVTRPTDGAPRPVRTVERGPLEVRVPRAGFRLRNGLLPVTGRMARGGSLARPARGTAGRSACRKHTRLAVGAVRQFVRVESEERPTIGRQRRNRLETSCHHRRRQYPARRQSDRRQSARRLQFTPLINSVSIVQALRLFCRRPDALTSGRGSNRRIAALFLHDRSRWQILKDIRQKPSRARPAESLLMTARQTIQCQGSDRVVLTCWPVTEDHV